MMNVESIRNWAPVRFIGTAGKVISEKPSEAGNIFKATAWGLKSTGQKELATSIELIDQAVTVLSGANITEELRLAKRETLPSVLYKTFTSAGNVTKLLLKLKVLNLGTYATPVGALFLANDFYNSGSMVISKGKDLYKSPAKIRKCAEKAIFYANATDEAIAAKRSQNIEALKTPENKDKLEKKTKKYRELDFATQRQKKQLKLDQARLDRVNNIVDIAFHVSLIGIFILMGAGLAGAAVAGSTAMITAGGFAATLGLVKVGLKVYEKMPSAPIPAPATAS